MWLSAGPRSFPSVERVVIFRLLPVLINAHHPQQPSLSPSLLSPSLSLPSTLSTLLGLQHRGVSFFSSLSSPSSSNHNNNKNQAISSPPPPPPPPRPRPPLQGAPPSPPSSSSNCSAITALIWSKIVAAMSAAWAVTITNSKLSTSVSESSAMISENWLLLPPHR